MSALAAYYSAQADEMASRSQLDLQQGNLARQQATNYGAESAARIGQENASANQANAAAKLTRVNASLAPGEADARNAEAAARTRGIDTTSDVTRATLPGDLVSQALKNTGLGIANTYTPMTAQSQLSTEEQNRAINQNNNFTPYVPPAGMAPPAGYIAPAGYKLVPATGFAKGGVVGKDEAKPTKADTVPAMLQPGEAVLNKHAVDHYGTDVVDQMNKMGMLRGKAVDELTQMAASVKGKGKGKKKAA